MIIISFVLLNVFTVIISGLDSEIDRYIVACRSTDYTCFKRQYQLFRDHLLLGNKQLDIAQYEPFIVQYSNTSTCVNITGVEESELVTIGYDGKEKRFWMSLTMPIRFQQVDWTNKTESCKHPDKAFEPKGPQEGTLKRFSGNATMELSYPFGLHQKQGDFFIILEEETIDTILDIADLSEGPALETKQYELSEWAYETVQHVDVPAHVLMPYTDQIKNLFGKLPLKSFLLLYPSEEYSELQFRYSDDDVQL